MVLNSARTTNPEQAWGPQALTLSRNERRAHQEQRAFDRDRWVRANRYYYDRMRRTLRYIIEPKKRVLEVRCQTGHFLAAVDPSCGVGVETSDGMVAAARRNYPNLQFMRCDPEELHLDEKFDYIIFSHVFDTVDILAAFERVRQHCTTDTRLIVINYNPLWQPVVEFASRIGLRAPFVEPNWLDQNDVDSFLSLAGFRTLRTQRLLLFPKYLPLVSWFFNDILGRIPGIRRLCMMQILVARPEPEPKRVEDISVSVIIPCRNERDNVQAAVDRIPQMGKHTEIIFCDDKSTDNTADEVRRMQALHPEKDIRLVNGPGICKAENVWTGFRAATGDVLMILDADLTVMPEELPTFLGALVGNRAEFINGSRLVYPVPKNAMKFTNRLGNKVFGMIFSHLLDRRTKDTLCGTKVFWKKDWSRIEKMIGSWGIKDLWGDYDLLFSASKLQLEIVDVPIHYQERLYGVTKMTRVFWNGVRMLRICWAAWNRLHG
jgi:SAM-dependent methyltransferase